MMLFLCGMAVIEAILLLVMMGYVFDLNDKIDDLYDRIERYSPTDIHANEILNGRIIYDD